MLPVGDLACSHAAIQALLLGPTVSIGTSLCHVNLLPLAPRLSMLVSIEFVRNWLDDTENTWHFMMIPWDKCMPVCDAAGCILVYWTILMRVSYNLILNPQR